MSTTMTLSEAIRLGAMATTQGCGSLSLMSDTAPCALGAARMAGGIKCDTTMSAYVALLSRWPVLGSAVAHPFRGDGWRVVDVVWTLNDSHNWTREQIADWVEAVEAQQADHAVDPVRELAERDLAPRVEVC